MYHANQKLKWSDPSEKEAVLVCFGTGMTEESCTILSLASFPGPFERTLIFRTGLNRPGNEASLSPPGKNS